MSRRGSKGFDPGAALNGLISAMEKEYGPALGDPGAACAAILSTARATFGEFERAVAGLHAAGQTAAVEIVVCDIERCMRRAVRLAGEHGGASTSTGETAHD